MVDLPTVPDRIPAVRAPESRVSESAAQSPWVNLAHSMELGEKETGDIAKQLAHTAGLQAVTRDEAGNIQVQRAPIFGDAAIVQEKAIILGATALGETEARNKLVDIRTQYKDDPQGFRIAAEAYRKETVARIAQSVGGRSGPDVAIALGKAIDHQSTEHYFSMLNQKERLDTNRSYAAINAQIETTKNELVALSNGGDTSSPAVQQRVEKLGVLYKQLVGNPGYGVPAERADFELGQFRSELDVNSLDHRISEIQKTQGTEAALREAEKIKTDPDIKLNAGQRLNYYSRLVGNIQSRVNAQKQIDTGIDREIDTIADAATRGNPVTPAQTAAVRAAVAQSGNPALRDKLLNAETIQPILADWRKSSPDLLQANLRDVERVMRDHGETPVLRTLYDSGTKLLKEMRDQAQADPLGWLSRTGAAPIAPIDLAQPETMRARIAAAETGANHLGQQPEYLSPAERQLINRTTAAGGDAMIKVAGSLVDGFGDRAPRVLAELGKESPVLTHIGSLMLANGSPSLMQDAADAVALRQNKEFKHPRWLEKETDTIQKAQHQHTIDVYGGAFLLAPDMGRRAEETGQSAFFTRSARGVGYDPKLETNDASKVYDRTMQEAAGARFVKDVQFGGVGTIKSGIWPFSSSAKVLVPSNIRADRFGDVLGAVRQEEISGAVDASGKPYPVSTIRKATPIAVNGGYRFALGDPASDDPKWVRGGDGQPFVLDLQRMEPVLRQRVPGAFQRD